MFPSMTDSRQNKRSLRALVRGAMDTALEFVTLGEATAPAHRTPPPAPTAGHPHRRQTLHRLSSRGETARLECFKPRALRGGRARGGATAPRASHVLASWST